MICRIDRDEDCHENCPRYGDCFPNPDEDDIDYLRDYYNEWEKEY